VAITADGVHAVSASLDKTVKVWELKTGTLLHSLNGHGESVQAVAITVDGTQAVSYNLSQLATAVSILEKLRISHLGKTAEKEFGAAGVISLFNSCSVPCSFPVRSLLRISAVRQKNLTMPMESRFLNAWREKAAVFSLYFSLLMGIRGRDGFAGDWHHRHSSCCFVAAVAS
jgi:WD domain, G-beta repeat